MFVYLYTTNAVMPHPQPRTGTKRAAVCTILDDIHHWTIDLSEQRGPRVRPTIHKHSSTCRLAYRCLAGVELGSDAQIGPTLGIVDDSFKGDYEDMVGVNARVGGRGEIIGLALHVEALPGSIVRRDEDSKEVGKNITSVTLNTKLFREFGPLEPYFVVGIGLVTVTQILFVAAAADEEFD